MDTDALNAERNATLAIPGVKFTGRGFRGGFFNAFFVRRSTMVEGPGWFVYGSNPAYGGRYTMLCAHPDAAARKYPGYNCKVHRGWRTKREADAVALELNNRDVAFLDRISTLPLNGTVFRD